MLGSLRQRLQSLSPLSSPVGSPTSSPRPRRRAFGFRRPAARLKQRRGEPSEVQSDPECDFGSSRQCHRKSSEPPCKVYFESGGGGGGGSSTPSSRHVSATVGRTAGHTQVQRLAQYERYFQDLLSETPANHPDVDDLTRVRGRLKQLVSSPGDDLSELERVQALFPADDLGLFRTDVSSQRMKGIIRKRSAPASRLQRVLSAKAQRPSSSERAAADDDKENSVPADATDGGARRRFIMETAVTFTAGVQSQERHLFLFTDMLLVAKARSGGNFKLKEKVRLSELWLADCIDEVAEVAVDPSVSFVMGWPIVNIVVTFSGSARDVWYSKLSQLSAAEREHETEPAIIQIMYRDPATNMEYSKKLGVSASTTARECVRSAACCVPLPAGGSHHQLWVRAAPHQPACPLLGHELPFAVQTSVAREAAADGRPEMDHCNNIYSSGAGCQFLLRAAGSQLRALSPSPDSAKKKKMLKKSPIRIHRVFRRANSRSDSVDSAVSCGPGALFGQQLSRLCPSGSIPGPVMAMLVQLFRKGPYTVGIFRKSANARVVKEIKEMLDNNIDVDMESVNIYAVAGLTKDFLRSLPDPLLGSHLYNDWRDVADIELEHDRILRVRELCARLPAANVTLLCHFLCVLHHVARRSHHNLMSATNVAVCVGPSLLAPSCQALALASDGAKRLPLVVALLVDKCDVIFGSQCLRLLGGRTARADSGEDSDGLVNGGGVRRNDSSIDSLEHELLGENEPLPSKDKMAATNLSRDSGLTLSDSQLYALDDEESASTSSGQSAHKSEHSACSSGRGSDNTFRRRPTGDSGGRAAPLRPASPAEVVYAQAGPPQRLTSSAFQRLDWTRQHHPLRRSSKPHPDTKSALRHSTSEESLTPRTSEPTRTPAGPDSHEPTPAPASPAMVRSRSAHHIAQLRDNRLALPPPEPTPTRHWARSRSTPHIDDADRSYDSSTLSDDDSTPHVSRSNSRGKDCAMAGQLYELPRGADGRTDPSPLHSGHGSLTSSRAGSVRVADVGGTPPSYDAAVSRWQRRGGSTVHALPENVIRQQTIMSSRAKQLYAESLRLYQQQTAGGPDVVRASPGRAVAGDAAPALPPKLKRPLPAAESTVIRIGECAAPRPHRPARREAQTQTSANEWAPDEARDERRRPPHVTLVSIEAAPRWVPADESAEPSWSVSRLRQMFSGDGPPPPYRHPPLRRAAAARPDHPAAYPASADIYAAPAAVRAANSELCTSRSAVYAANCEIYATPADLYAAVPRSVPLGRTQSAGSSNDGEESYV